MGNGINEFQEIEKNITTKAPMQPFGENGELKSEEWLRTDLNFCAATGVRSTEVSELKLIILGFTGGEHLWM